MKFVFFGLLSISLSQIYGQKLEPRFGVEVAPYSMVFYPKQFENIATPNQYDQRLYTVETWDVNYSKLNFSIGLSIGFNVNWIEREKWRLAHRFSLGSGKFIGTTELTLRSHGDSLKTNLPYTTSEVSVGYQSSAQIQGCEYFLSTDLVLFRKFEKNWSLGVGVGFQQISRPRGMYTSSTGYFPTWYPRGSIATDCLSPTIHLQSEKNWAFLCLFINYSQAVYITKSKTYFGETNGKRYPEPSSLNEASRLPGRLMIGCRFNWGD